MPALSLLSLLVATVIATSAAEDARGGAAGPATAPEKTLAERFAPILLFDSREVFRPISREQYLNTTALRVESKENYPPIAPVDIRSPSLGDLGPTPRCAALGACKFYLDIRGLDPWRRRDRIGYVNIARNLAATKTPTVYWTFQAGKTEVAVQYWFLYLFNDWFNRHESDWEQVTIRFTRSRCVSRPDRSSPMDVVYSSHESGEYRRWRRLSEPLERRGLHVVVHVARGSHANYFTGGPRFISHAVSRRILRHEFNFKVKVPRRDTTDDAGVHLEPDDYMLRQLDAPVFAGDWSSGNFIWRRPVGKPIAIPDPRLQGAGVDPLDFVQKIAAGRRALTLVPTAVDSSMFGGARCEEATDNTEMLLGASLQAWGIIATGALAGLVSILLGLVFWITRRDGHPIGRIDLWALYGQYLIATLIVTLVAVLLLADVINAAAGLPIISAVAALAVGKGLPGGRGNG